MRKLSALGITVVASIGVALVATPAYAADTTAVIEITGGSLSISAPVGEVTATPITAGVDATTVTFPLGDVAVTDAIGGTAGWTAAVTVTDFESENSTLPIAGGSYATGVVEQTGLVTVTPSDSTTLALATTVVTGTAASGVNTAAWNPTVTVAVPAGALAGMYSSTVTHSVL